MLAVQRVATSDVRKRINFDLRLINDIKAAVARLLVVLPKFQLPSIEITRNLSKTFFSQSVLGLSRASSVSVWKVGVITGRCVWLTLSHGIALLGDSCWLLGGGFVLFITRNMPNILLLGL